MCLRFVFLLITPASSWLQLSRHEETWKTAEILILRHQLAVLQRQQPRRPNLDWADRALLATLHGVIPKARGHVLRLLVGVLPAVQSEVRIGVQRVDGQLSPVPKSCSPSSWPSRKVKRARSVRSSARP